MSVESAALVPGDRAPWPFVAVYRALALLALALTGMLFGPAHRLLPRLGAGGAATVSASLGFFAAALLQHAVQADQAISTTLWTSLLAYGVLLALSAPRRMAEFTLCLALWAGFDLLSCGLAWSGAMAADDPAAGTGLLGWQLVATFVALLRLRLARWRARGS